MVVGDGLGNGWLKTPGWVQTAGKSKWQLDGRAPSSAGREGKQHREGVCIPREHHPAPPSSLCSLTAAPRVPPAVYQPLKTRLKINGNRLSKAWNTGRAEALRDFDTRRSNAQTQWAGKSQPWYRRENTKNTLRHHHTETGKRGLDHHLLLLPAL